MAEFHRWVIPECLAKIDNIWPEKKYSKSCEPPGAYLEPVQVKTTELPIVRAKKAEQRENEALALLAEVKEEGLAREALKDKALKKERKEKERLRELLHKAGVDPGTDS